MSGHASGRTSRKSSTKTTTTTTLITQVSMMNRSPLAGETTAENNLLQGSKRVTKPLAQVARKQPHATRTLLPVATRIWIPVRAPRRRRRNLRPALQPREQASQEPSALGNLIVRAQSSQTPHPVLIRASSTLPVGTWASPTKLGATPKTSLEEGVPRTTSASAKTRAKAASLQLASQRNGNAALRFKKSPTPSTTTPFSLAGAPTLVSPEPCCGRGEDVATHVTWAPPS